MHTFIPTGLSTARRWVQANGHTASNRRRLPTAVRQAYNTAH
ncbi:Lsr2 family protein (plasmid) [Rhodococcus antarcticus]|uniref:Lsr2 family protein n=1 Tax=Rhodococcus antarcticus TaxID=2987751 RepID=A0ABY6P5N3_9NOCA|nr:hypothetical protein [Rhodococcus antarcticus]UZJ26980.1 Lsr2 family protein [Rhodococcus antarcticus]